MDNKFDLNPGMTMDASLDRTQSRLIKEESKYEDEIEENLYISNNTYRDKL